jgi:aminobenzoyl-glutamate utilization protein A
LDGVDFCIGSHISDLSKEEGVEVTPGAYGSLSTCKYDVTYHGVSSHASGKPQLGKNALLAAATAALNLSAIARHGEGGTRVNVGRLIAGSGRNVIPDEAFMEVEVRGDTTEINEYMCDKAMRIIEHAAAMYDCTSEVKLMGAASSVNSDPDFAQRIAGIAEKVGLKPATNRMAKSGGSEDFAYMMNRVQEQGGKAAFVRIHTKLFAPAHNRRLDFIESDYFHKAIKIFCASVYDILK